ncbi:MAG: acyl-CoA thioesterase [Puniceicoccales bacterium]|nr:acyl-CoA thioesterase [Puniceicoccales bacterium]
MEAVAYTHKHTVAFVEADPAGITHFSRYPLWVEEAETAFWREHGKTMPVVAVGGLEGWPKVSFSIRYRAPVRHNDEVIISMRAEHTSSSTLTWRFRITRGDTLCATGEMGVVYACGNPLKGELSSRPIPEALLGIVKPFCIRSA